MDSKTAMTVTGVVQLPKGISIRVVCEHGWYAYTINDGEPTWFKDMGGYGVGLDKNKKEDAKLIRKLEREWKNARYWG